MQERRTKEEDDMSDRTRFVLDERDMPTAWYNINPDLPEPPAPQMIVSKRKRKK